jgi:peptidoglycan/LPS O-acetylase OafA/YrhL
MLSDFLSSKRNNLDLLRLFAACAVIYWHAHSLTGRNIADLGIWITHGHDPSGGLAVKFFFFVSGLVTTNSLLRSRLLLHWSAARFLRIVPAYVMALILTAFVLVPLFSNQGAGILETKTPYHYVIKNISALFCKGNLVFNIEGVFSGFPYTSVNGSIWTLPFEVKAYYVIGALFLLGIFRSKYLATAVLVAILVAETTVPNATHLFGAYAAPAHLLPCFAVGALFALWSDKIALRADILVGLTIAAVVTISLPAYPALYCAVLFYGSLVLSTQDWFVRLKPPADISYGTYLYGWPSQMLIVGLAPNLPIGLHIAFSVALAMALGLASWTFIEKRVKLRPSSDRAESLPRGFPSLPGQASFERGAGELGKSFAGAAIRS